MICLWVSFGIGATGDDEELLGASIANCDDDVKSWLSSKRAAPADILKASLWQPSPIRSDRT